MKTVLLQDGTIGTTEEEVVLNQVITVVLHDENGNEIFVTGIVEEIFD